MKLLKLSIVLAVTTVLNLPDSAFAQLNIEGAIKRGLENETNRQAEKLARGAVRCAFDNLKCIKKANKKGKPVVLTDENGQILTDDEGNPITDPSQLGGKPPGLSSSSSSGYDFKPGTRVLFEQDFAAGADGEFPPELEQIQGQMRVVEWNGQSYLRAEEKYSRMAVPLPETLPDAFTLEFDLYEGTGGGDGVSIALVEPSRFDFAWSHYYDHDYFNIGHRQTAGIWAPQGQKISIAEDQRPSERVVPVRIMVAGAQAKMYIGKNRVAAVSDISLGRSDRIYFFLESQPPENLTYVGNIRVAAIETATKPSSNP